MGYELYITRAEAHYESEEHPIDLSEWLAYAHGHPALVEGGWLEWSDVGRVPVFAYTCTDGTEVSLSWSDGAISISGVADEAGALDLVKLASDLQANLLGDDGERYTATGVIPAE